MKKLLIFIVLIFTPGIVIASEHWFVVATSTLGKSTVLEVYGWDNNYKPCITLANAMNILLEADGDNILNKRFSCMDQKAADILDKNNPVAMREVK